MRTQLELNKKKTWPLLPYVYFIGLVAFWFFMDLFVIKNFSYVAFGIMTGLIIQAIIQNKAAGTSLGILATIGSLYAFLAVLSEFNDFDAVTKSALQLIIVGSALSLSGLAMGIIMTATSLKISNVNN